MKSKSEPREYAERTDLLNKYGLEIIHRVPKKTLNVPRFLEHVKTERRLGTEKRVRRKEDREKTLLDAIQFYPIDFFSKNKIGKIYIYSSEGGGFFHPASRTVAIGFDDTDPEFAKNTLHHELNHRLFFTREGMNFGKEWQKTFVREVTISALLLKLIGKQINLEYKQGKYVGGRYKSLVNCDPGFFRKYAQSKLIEDVAVSSEIIADPYFVKKRISGKIEMVDFLNLDKIKLRKIAMLMDFYYLKSGGKMDESFWRDFASGIKIDYNYWKNRDAENNYKPAPRSLKEARLKFQQITYENYKLSSSKWPMENFG